MAGIIGNALAPAKNEINFLQTNNLDNLKRNKRQSTTTPIPGTTYEIKNCEITIESNQENWGSNFILRIGRQATQTLSRLNTLQNWRDAVGSLAGALGITGSVWSGDTIALTTALPAGVASLLAVLLNRLRENPAILRNLFRNVNTNNDENGIKLEVREDPINQISITTTSTRTKYFTNICIEK